MKKTKLSNPAPAQQKSSKKNSVTSSKSRVKKSTLKDKPKKKQKYKLRNWSEYNKSLIQRGSLEIWISEDVKANWQHQYKEGEKRKRGGQYQFSDIAIQSCCTVGKVYKEPLRQTQGLVESIFNLSGVELVVPNYTTLSRRLGKAQIKIPKKNKGKVVMIVDSTGIKVYGEGEWKVRKHGYSKRRTWLKIHASYDRDGEIRAVNITDNKVDDAQGGRKLIKQQKSDGDDIDKFYGDGAYDKRKLYRECQDNNIDKIIIPPQKNAKIWHHSNCKGPPHPRDENLRAIRKTTRKKWKQEIGYHIRSLSETGMFRLKTIFTDKVRSREISRQVNEIKITCAALNVMTHLGMPNSYLAT